MEVMRFKVGDKVRVKKELILGEGYGTFPFVNLMKEHNVLTLRKIEGSEHERDVAGTYYGMTNPLD